MTQMSLTRDFLADCNDAVLEVGAHGPLAAEHRTFTQVLKDMGHDLMESLSFHHVAPTTATAKAEGSSLGGFRNKLSSLRDSLENTQTASPKPR